MTRFLQETSPTMCTVHRILLGQLLSPKSYMDVPAGSQKSDFLYTNFLPNFPPISILFLKKKKKSTQFWPNWVLYNNLPKMHPIYVIWAPSSDETPNSYTKFCKKSTPKGRHIGLYIYHVNVRNLPPPHTLRVLSKEFRNRGRKVPPDRLPDDGCNKKMTVYM